VRSSKMQFICESPGSRVALLDYDRHGWRIFTWLTAQYATRSIIGLFHGMRLSSIITTMGYLLVWRSRQE
jgi:hypothetical protein